MKVWLYVRNNGDGSPGLSWHKTRQEADKAADKDREKYGENYCDDVMEVDLGEIARRCAS